MKNKQISLIIYLIAQLIIYSFTICFNNIFNENIMFIISSVLSFSLGIYLFCKTKDYYIMITSIGINVLISIFNLYLINFKYIVYFLLNLVQILYFLRIYINSENKKKDLIIRLIELVLGLVLSFILLRNKTDYISILFTLYISNLFFNILYTIKDIGFNNFFPIGLFILFISAIFSLFIGVEDYITVNIPFINIINDFPFSLVLMFEMPANVVLACSVFTVNRRMFSKINNEEEEEG